AERELPFLRAHHRLHRRAPEEGHLRRATGRAGAHEPAFTVRAVRAQGRHHAEILHPAEETRADPWPAERPFRQGPQHHRDRHGLWLHAPRPLSGKLLEDLRRAAIGHPAPPSLSPLELPSIPLAAAFFPVSFPS